MITSNARAEFTTNTTIIVVLACPQRENMAAWLAQRVVLGRSTRAKLGADSRGRLHVMQLTTMPS